MSKRKAATAAPAVDDYETQADRELDEELDETLSIGDDDDDDLWDSDEAAADADGAEGAVDAIEEPAFVAIADEFSAFVVATLPAKMKRRRLADQSSEWLLSTIGRIVDEIASARGTPRDDSDDIVDLEVDLLTLVGAAEIRGIDQLLSLETRAFVDGVAGKIDDAHDGGASEAASPTSSATNLQIEYIPRLHIYPDPAQPRAHADAELKESIRASGILQPITVRRQVGMRGGYLIVDGERRWQGAADVLEIIPCIVRDDQEDEYVRLKTQLVANTGKALSPIEEAKAFARMLQANDVGVAALARDIGRPPSSVNDRLKLLELGPWLDLIGNGSVSLSMAVEHLVPLRGIPDEYHLEAIAKITEGLEAGDEIAVDVESFGHTVAREYDRYMYPIAKSKNEYEKQPLFNTKAHDAECSCGGISWGGSWQGIVAKGRKFCGNPDWWKPLHAAAKKKEREAAKESGESSTAKKGELRIELPAGTKTVKTGYNQPPKDIVQLTDEQGRWRVVQYFGDVDHAFDPADLEIDESKLVRLTPTYGMDRVGLRDAAAVGRAQAAFVARFAPAREKVGKKLLAEFEKLTDTYSVAGAGVHVLLEALDVANLEYAEAADLLSIELPDAVRKVDYNRARTPALRDWFAKSLKRADGERLLSFIAFLKASEKRELPSAAIMKDVRDAVEEIQRKRAPWATSKASKPAAKKKAGAK